MDHRQLLLDLFSRVDEHVHEAVVGLDAVALATAPEADANTIGWLVWHLVRVHDHHLSEVLGQDQIYLDPRWQGRFGVTPRADDTGYGHDADRVRAVRPDGAASLLDYHETVSARTREFLGRLTPDQLDEVVDRRWDPPVTLGVRLISVADDAIQHAGQAAYVRGVLERR